jgi:glucose-1-phosphate thymidylyltransferase
MRFAAPSRASRIPPRMEPIPARGLICAGGEATRLGELTRAANKHLLPVGRWPMIYYPLQLLQFAGVREVLVVTGKGHAGQMIDLLGDGRLATRGADEPLLDLDLTYKVQTEPGGIAQVVGMARDFAGGRKLVVLLGDNVFEHGHSAEIKSWIEDGAGARIFVKDVPDPENFGVVAYDEDGRVVDIVEKAGVVDTRYERPPTSHAVVGLYCYPPDVFEVIDSLEPSSRGELEITDVNRHYAQRGELDVVEVRGWWEDAGKHWQHLADIGRLVEDTGVNK